MLRLKKSLSEVYNMALDDVIYTYMTFYIDSYNTNRAYEKRGK